MHNREFKFGYQHFLLCQKSFLKVSSKWLLKNKSDNGKLLLGKTDSGEHFRAILALLFKKHLLVDLYKYCSYDAPRVTTGPGPGVTSSKHRNREGKLQNSSLKLESAEL